MAFRLFKRIGEGFKKWWGKNYEPSNNCHSEFDAEEKYKVSLEGEVSNMIGVLMSEDGLSLGVYNYIERLKQREGLTQECRTALDTVSGIALIKRAYEKKERTVSFKSYLKAYLLRGRVTNKERSFVEVPFAYTLNGKKPAVKIHYSSLEKYFGISEASLEALEAKDKIGEKLGIIRERLKKRERRQPLYEVFAPGGGTKEVYKDGSWEVSLQPA